MQQSYLDRFFRYVSFDTQSDSTSQTVPSTPKQKILGAAIQDEMQDMGLSDVFINDNGYVMGKLPGNLEGNVEGDVPAIGFVAHMDTALDASGANVKPQIVENYNGEAIVLNENVSLDPAEFPKLKNYIGKTLITTDGTTLLGADNKAGIAAILTAVEFLQANPEIPHGDICIGFTPDEEIGRGADHFDVPKFGAKWAYTIDGGEEGELECENFNAAAAKVTCHGRSVHPGTAKDAMINAQTLARAYASDMPAMEVPEYTEGHEGFIHLQGSSGNVTTAELNYIIRDHDKEKFEARKELMLAVGASMNKQLGEERVVVEITDNYRNMKEEIDKVPHVVDIAREAMVKCGVKPLEKPIRGGTDGARLSFKGLPCPNIFTGGHNFHGVHEYLVVESAMKSVDVIVEVARLTAEKYKG